MAKIGKKIVKLLMKSGLLKLHTRYVDDTLQITKADDIKYMFHNKCNSFHNNLTESLKKKSLDKNSKHYGQCHQLLYTVELQNSPHKISLLSC